jgi:hypothetical protein
MRERFIYDRIQGCVVPADEYQRPELQRSFLPSPMLVRDSMEPTQHPVDGKFYDSKSAFSGLTKSAGFVEVGNDPARLRQKPKPKPDRAAIKDAVHKAAAHVKSR